MREPSSIAFGLVAVAFSAACTNVTTEQPESVPLDPWVKTYPGNQSPTAIASGAEGDLFVGGEFDGTIDFGGGHLTSAPNGSLFMAHLDEEGGHLFSGSTGSGDSIGSVAIGPQGDLYVAGHYDGLVNFGEGKSEATQAGFLAAFRKDGSSDYAKSFDGFQSVFVDRVQALPNGDVIIAARADQSTDFGNGAGPSELHNTQGVIAAFDHDGHPLWDTRIDCNIGDEVSMVADSAGNVFAAALCYTPVSMGGLNSPEGVFLARLDAAGKPLGLHTLSNGNYPTVHDMAIDAEGNLYLSGVYAYGTLTYAGIALPEADYHTGYLVKTTPDGDGIFGKAVRGRQAVQNLDFALSADGDIAVVASAYGGIDFGNGLQSTGESWDGFLAWLGPNGELLRAEALDGTSTDLMFDVVLGPDDRPVISGAFAGELDLGGEHLTADFGMTMFVARTDF